MLHFLLFNLCCSLRSAAYNSPLVVFNRHSIDSLEGFPFRTDDHVLDWPSAIAPGVSATLIGTLTRTRTLVSSLCRLNLQAHNESFGSDYASVGDGHSAVGGLSGSVCKHAPCCQTRHAFDQRQIPEPRVIRLAGCIAVARWTSVRLAASLDSSSVHSFHFPIN
jgi:hypothetical protein